MLKNRRTWAYVVITVSIHTAMGSLKMVSYISCACSSMDPIYCWSPTHTFFRVQTNCIEASISLLCDWFQFVGAFSYNMQMSLDSTSPGFVVNGKTTVEPVYYFFKIKVMEESSEKTPSPFPTLSKGTRVATSKLLRVVNKNNNIIV